MVCWWIFPPNIGKTSEHSTNTVSTPPSCRVQSAAPPPPPAMVGHTSRGRKPNTSINYVCRRLNCFGRTLHGVAQAPGWEGRWGGRGVGIDIPAPPLLIVAIKSSFPQLPGYYFPHTTLLRPLAFDPAHIIVAEEAVWLVSCSSWVSLWTITWRFIASSGSVYFSPETKKMGIRWSI